MEQKEKIYLNLINMEHKKQLISNQIYQKPPLTKKRRNLKQKHQIDQNSKNQLVSLTKKIQKKI